MVHSIVSGSGVATDDDQVTGPEREIMMTEWKGLDPYNMLATNSASGTKETPNLACSITNKRIMGCLCGKDNSSLIGFWQHKGETQ